MGLRLAALLGLALLACGGPAREPEEVVELYLRCLGRDPVRSLDLLEPAFHAAHGLRFEEVGERPFAPAEARRATPSGDAGLELERARFGWLSVLSRRIFALQSPRLQRETRLERVRGDRAWVSVRVRDPVAPALTARFALRRGGDARWRIEAVELGEVAPAQLVAAFLTAPNVDLFRRMQARRAERRGPGTAP